MTKGKKLLVLGAGRLQLPIIKKAKEMGLYVVATDWDPNSIGFNFADKFIVEDFAIPEIALKIAKDEKVNGVIHPCSEVAMASLGLINRSLNLSGIDTDTAIRSTHKNIMKECFTKNNISTPLSISVNNISELLSVTTSFLGHVIIKPSRSSGSKGTTRLSVASKKEKFEEAFNVALSLSRDSIVLIEQFIGGMEFSVEILSWNNKVEVLSVTDKLTTGNPHYIEIGHSQPSSQSEINLDKIKKLAIGGVKALGINWSAAHAEIKLFKGNPFILEIGARLGGDFISTSLVNLSTGIDMVKAAINVSLGLVPDLTPNHKKQGAAIRYIILPTGTISEIPNNFKLTKRDNLQDFELYIKPGSKIPPLRSSIDRSGHIITSGIDGKDAMNKTEIYLKEIIENIHFNKPKELQTDNR